MLKNQQLMFRNQQMLLKFRHASTRPGIDRMDLAPAAMTGFLDWLRGTNDPPVEPLPGEWVSFLREHCAHYRRLPDVLQPTFEGCVQRFITTKRITGVKVEADDDLRLLVAASAATLSLRWPGYKWSEVTEVLLYPDAFDRDFTIGNREIAGLAHGWGTVILSVPALWHSFDYPDEPYHLGLHEFSHLLTTNQGMPLRLRWREMETSGKPFRPRN